MHGRDDEIIKMYSDVLGSKSRVIATKKLFHHRSRAGNIYEGALKILP